MADEADCKPGRLPVVKSLSEVARHFRVAQSTVGEWRANGMPGNRGVWDLNEISAWKTQRKRDNFWETHQNDPDLKKKILVEELRIKRADAERRERENRTAEQQIIYRHDLDRFLSGFFLLIRDLLDRVPEDMSPQLPASVRDRVLNEISQRHEMVLLTCRSYAERAGEIEVPEDAK